MWQSIVDSFTDLTPMMWASQICGIIGFVIIMISYQFKRKTFLLVSGISYLFFVAEQVLAGLYCNAIVSGVSLIRNIVMFFFLLKYKKELPYYACYIILGVMYVGCFTYMIINGEALKEWTNYLVIGAVTIYTLCENAKNYYVLKAGAFIHESIFLTYYLILNIPYSSLRQIILVLSIVISVIRMIVIDVKKKKENTNNGDNENA